MPSNRPRLMTYTTDEIIKKFEEISKEENRSMSKELEYIVKEYIKNYERKKEYQEKHEMDKNKSKLGLSTSKIS